MYMYSNAIEKAINGLDVYKRQKYGDVANFAELAHIHAVGASGPRHCDELTQDEINQIKMCIRDRQDTDTQYRWTCPSISIH